MVRRTLILGALVVLGSAPAPAARAAQIQFTGNVEKDLPAGPGTVIIPSNLEIDIPDWMRAERRTSGMEFRDIRMHYDSASDTMFVGINTNGIAGDIDGDGNPGGSDPRTTAGGGVDMPHFGGRETMVVGFDLNNDRKPDIAAGIPADKAMAGPGIDGFNITAYDKSATSGLPLAFGKALQDQFGGLAFDPDQDHPGFEFSIKNFSKLPGYNVKNGLGITAFSGSLDATVVGKDVLPYTAISAQEAVPEPATVLGWSLLIAGGAAWHRLRRRPDPRI